MRPMSDTPAIDDPYASLAFVLAETFKVRSVTGGNVKTYVYTPRERDACPDGVHCPCYPDTGSCCDCGANSTADA